MHDDVISMRFDQYQRYRLVADLLESLREGEAPLRVLDVGGRTALLRRFMKDEVVLVDMEPSDAEGLILGSGSQLPFQDRSFDAVAAFDTLEHVPPEHRDAFVAECVRVTRRHVVLAGPYSAPKVVEAEALLQRFMTEKLGRKHRYLDEHIDYGLPVREATEARMRELGGEVVSIGHANLERWLVCQCVAFYMDYDESLKGLQEAFSTFYNRELYASDHAEPVYRHLVVGAFHGAPLPRAEELLSPPVAPAGTIGAFTELATELMAFDQGREAWHAERKQRDARIAELEAELAATRAREDALTGEVERLTGKLPMNRLKRALGVRPPE